MEYTSEQIKEIVTLAVDHLNKTKNWGLTVERFEDNPEHWNGTWVKAIFSIDKNSFKKPNLSAIKETGPDENRVYWHNYYSNNLLSRAYLEQTIAENSGFPVKLEQAMCKLIPIKIASKQQEAILCAAAYIFVIVTDSIK